MQMSRGNGRRALGRGARDDPVFGGAESRQLSDGGARGIFRTGGTEVQLGRVFDFRLALPSPPPSSIRGKSISPVISSYITRSC